MHIFTKLGLGMVALCGLVTSVGCSSASDDSEPTATSTEALTRRCTVRGNPAVTTGCDSGDTCSVIACTNSVPPSCWGVCKPTTPPPPPPSKCTGAFNCLCGTPTCVDGDWTCVGSCGETPAAAPKVKACVGAFNCLCGAATCIDGDWTCVGNCGPGGTPE